jgi:hypothetical protein
MFNRQTDNFHNVILPERGTLCLSSIFTVLIILYTQNFASCKKINLQTY